MKRMRFISGALAPVCLLGLWASELLAQGATTGTVAGRVVAEGQPLPGVLVTAESPALMGVRTTHTNVNGDYILPSLAPGDYTVIFELEGFVTATREVRASTALETRLNVTMTLEEIVEEIVVTAETEAISRTATAASTFTTDTLDRLPVGRSMLAAVSLAAGVHFTGPNSQVSVAGSHSFENLFLVNGVVVNENIRGQPFPMFIEDAILETTTMVSGVSAEYGRFSGGVVNTLTKSGGNRFDGSLRSGLTNTKWRARRPFERDVDLESDLIARWEATLGGPFVRDRLWFFGAGMLEDFSADRRTIDSNLAYKFEDEETRWEVKLTGAVTPQHSFVGSFMNRTRDQTNNAFGNIMDFRSLDNRSLPEEFWTLSYTGILSPTFFVELRAAEREFTFEGSGAKTRDMIEGTMLITRTSPIRRWWSPTFCGICPDEERNMENYLGKATWFLSTEQAGTHNLIFGFDSYNDVRAVDNHQTGSDFRIHALDAIIVGSDVYPIFTADGNTWIRWNPIFEPTRGTALWTHSLFVNDRWQVNDRLAFNLGIRYDRNDGKNALREQVTKDDMFSPRLGVTYDLRGDGDWVVNASVGRYVAAVANNIADSTSVAGTPATFLWEYFGPEINTDPSQPLVGNREAIETFLTWFCGGIDQATLTACQQDPRALAPIAPFFFSVPGQTSAIRDGRLDSPSTDEVAVGVSKQLAGRGLVRADIVHRDYSNFYATFRNLQTIGLGDGDFALIGNTNDLERVYTGLHTQVTYRFTDRLQSGLGWAWSHARGDFNGETGPNATITSGLHNYPEYTDPRWNNPRRNLAVDERHRARLWASYELFSSDRYGSLGVGLVQSFNSGSTYSAVGTIALAPGGVPFVPNPGYANPPTTASYWFTRPDVFKTDDITSTAIQLNYSFSLNLGNRRTELFVLPQITNLFNEQGVVVHNTLVRTASNTLATSCGGSPCQPFNPFTETPVQGVHWEFGPLFGQPTAVTHYQAPRTFRFSVGVRF